MIRTHTREEAIVKTVQHLSSVGYEHGFHLPFTGWEDRTEQMHRTFVEDLYVRAGSPEFGIPPELIYLYGENQIHETDGDPTSA